MLAYGGDVPKLPRQVVTKDACNQCHTVPGAMLHATGGNSSPVFGTLARKRFTEITSGLSTGDLVVVSLDRPEVHAGVRARITEEAEK